MPVDYFNEAAGYYEAQEYGKALEGYRYIMDHHPKNELYPMAVYNVGYLYYRLDSTAKAIQIFNTILRSRFNEKDRLGGGIMADPYANYKHRAGELLSEVYYKQQQYDSALHYFSLSDTANPYLHFCGNEYAANDVYTALRYADIYKKLAQPDKAIQHLLKAVFINLADNTEVLTALEQLLKGRPGLQTTLDAALQHIYNKPRRSGKSRYNEYYFSYLGAEVRVLNPVENDRRQLDKQKTIDHIRQTPFYKMIAAL